VFTKFTCLLIYVLNFSQRLYPPLCTTVLPCTAVPGFFFTELLINRRYYGLTRNKKKIQGGDTPSKCINVPNAPFVTLRRPIVNNGWLSRGQMQVAILSVRRFHTTQERSFCRLYTVSSLLNGSVQQRFQARRLSKFSVSSELFTVQSSGECVAQSRVIFSSSSL